MKHSNPDVYPVTARTERALGDAALAIPAVRQIVDILGEYEHGTADVDIIHPDLTLEMYAAVILDLALTLANRDDIDL